MFKDDLVSAKYVLYHLAKDGLATYRHAEYGQHDEHRLAENGQHNAHRLSLHRLLKHIFQPNESTS